MTCSRCHTPIASPALSNNVRLQKDSKIMGSLRLDSNTNIPFMNTMNDMTNQLNYNEPAICLDYLWSDAMMGTYVYIYSWICFSLYIHDIVFFLGTIR